MVSFRPLSSDFQIDGKNMPIPNTYETKTQIISTDDSGRLAGNGAMQIEFLTHVFVTTWTYKYMTGDEYDTVYDAYIKSTIQSKNMYHTIKTINSADGNSLTYKIYTQDETQATLIKRFSKPTKYMSLSFLEGGRLYKNITFTFVGVGGDNL